MVQRDPRGTAQVWSHPRRTEDSNHIRRGLSFAAFFRCRAISECEECNPKRDKDRWAGKKTREKYLSAPTLTQKGEGVHVLASLIFPLRSLPPIRRETESFDRKLSCHTSVQQQLEISTVPYFARDAWNSSSHLILLLQKLWPLENEILRLYFPFFFFPLFLL